MNLTAQGSYPKGSHMNSHPAGDLVIRFNPTEFWSATRLMSETERDVLLTAVTKLAEATDLEGLRQFKFVSITHRPAPQVA
jgi:hypothetical protein